MLQTMMAVAVSVLIVESAASWFVLWQLQHEVADISRQFSTDMTTRAVKDEVRLQTIENRQMEQEALHQELEARVNYVLTQCSVRVRIETKDAGA